MIITPVMFCWSEFSRPLAAVNKRISIKTKTLTTKLQVILGNLCSSGRARVCDGEEVGGASPLDAQSIDNLILLHKRREKSEICSY